MNCIATITNRQGKAALNCIDLAIKSGCKAVKIQKHSPENYFVKAYLDSKYNHYMGVGSTVGEIYDNLEFPFEYILTLRDYCRGKIDFWYSPFDLESLSYQEKIKADRVYISSPILSNMDLMQKIMSLDSPVAVSIPVVDARELEWLLDMINNNGKRDVIYFYHMRGVGTLEKTNCLKMLAYSVNKYRKVGFEETARNILVMAALIGARYFEFPISFSNSNIGFEGPEESLSPNTLNEVVVELKELVRELESDDVPHIRTANRNEKDRETLSLVAKVDMEPGVIIEKKMLTLRAPYRGLSPHMLDKIVGSKVLYPIKKDDYLTFGMIEIRSTNIT